ncbi:MAG: hypothetical protein Q8L56_09550 [Rhodocyclaceae bacterium]|nr:hypothetical protein [Rhodocyclaceae bacterium]
MNRFHIVRSLLSIFALLGVENLKSLWVLYWFDRNDSPEKRAILQVHPRGDPDRPLRGVFAPRAPRSGPTSSP